MLDGANHMLAGLDDQSRGSSDDSAFDGTGRVDGAAEMADDASLVCQILRRQMMECEKSVG